MARRNQADATAALVASAGGAATTTVPGESPAPSGTNPGGVLLDDSSANGATGNTEAVGRQAADTSIDGRPGEALAEATGGTGVAKPESDGAESGFPVIDAISAELVARASGTATPDSASPVQARIQARVLLDGRFGKANSVVVVTVDDAAAAVGELDPHPAAVAYAKSVG